ncbi:DUF3017 domain-containing protein [Streptomyces sp. NPDC002643]
MSGAVVEGTGAGAGGEAGTRGVADADTAVDGDGPTGTAGVDGGTVGADGGRAGVDGAACGTRRFPMLTRDTARPEGGGRAAPRSAPAPVRQWPILVVLATVGLGLLVTAFDAFRIGTILIGSALLAGAVLRWFVRDVGMLAVRSRFTDMITYIVLGTAIVLLALMAQPEPWLQLPFLKDILHFTVSEETG